MFDNLASLAQGFVVALTWKHLLFMVIGVGFGLVVGVLPGLGAPNGVGLLLPLTFGMEPVSAVILLTSLYWGALIGGSTTSILFNIPGEPSSVATTFRRLPDGEGGRSHESAHLRLPVIGLRRAVRRCRGDAPGQPGRALCAPVLAGRVLRSLVLAFASFIAFGGDRRSRHCCRSSSGWRSHRSAWTRSPAACG